MSESSQHGRPPSGSRHGRVKRHKPELFNLLSAVGLDVSFHRATGDLLYYAVQRLSARHGFRLALNEFCPDPQTSGMGAGACHRPA